MFDFLYQHARSMDLETGTESFLSLGTKGGKIAWIGEGKPAEEAQTIVDLHGAYLLPGMIDFHTHSFTGGSRFGVNADLFLSTGVTLAVDMGTAGYIGYETFRQTDLLPRTMPLKTFLNLSPVGQPGTGIHEPLNREIVLEDEMEKLIQAYPDEIRGIKVRISKEIVGNLGIEPLKRAIEVAERFHLPVCVHTTNPPVRAGEIVNLLRPGDIYSHTYHGKGNTILDENGKIQKEFFEAQKRGVILEVGHGRMNFSYRVAEAAAKEGLYPDIISSDATSRTFENAGDLKDLPMVMSKFLNLGMPLSRVIRSVTETPAKSLGLLDSRSFLKVGADANLTALRLEEKPVHFTDSEGASRMGKRCLIPELTVLKGRIVYLQGQAELYRSI